MEDWIVSEEEALLYKKIQEKQKVLDEGWNKPKYPQRFIGSRRVSEEEWENYQREQRERMRELSQVERYTSTGEEWEVNSDGEYTPDWLNESRGRS